MLEVLEMMPIFLIYMIVIFAPILFLAVLFRIGVFVLFCVYKCNGGKYSFKKFVDTRGLYI